MSEGRTRHLRSNKNVVSYTELIMNSKLTVDYQQGVKRTGTNDLARSQLVKQKKEKTTTRVARSTNSTMDGNDNIVTDDGTTDMMLPLLYL